MKKFVCLVFIALTFLLFSCSAEDTTSVSLEEYDFFVYPSSDLESSDARESAVSSDEESESSNSEIFEYVLNKNTMKFHLPDCQSVKLMKEETKLYHLGERDAIIYRGFSPCQHCMP